MEKVQIADVGDAWVKDGEVMLARGEPATAITSAPIAYVSVSWLQATGLRIATEAEATEAEAQTPEVPEVEAKAKKARG